MMGSPKCCMSNSRNNHVPCQYFCNSHDQIFNFELSHVTVQFTEYPMPYNKYFLHVNRVHVMCRLEEISVSPCQILELTVAHLGEPWTVDNYESIYDRILI